MHKSLDHEIKIKFKKSPGQGACLKGMSRTIIIQGKKTQLRHIKIHKVGQGACLMGMSRTITMQGFNLAAITGQEKKINSTLC